MSDHTKILADSQKEMLKLIAPMTKNPHTTKPWQILTLILKISPWLERPHQ